MSKISPKQFLKIPHYKQELNNSCLPACIRMVLSFFNITKSEQDIRRLVKIKPAGVNPLNLIHLKNWDIEVNISFSNFDILEDIITQKKPSIALLWTGELDYWDSEKYFDYLHAVVVIGIDNENILVNDPAFSKYPQHFPVNNFLEAWSYSQYMLILIEKPSSVYN